MTFSHPFSVLYICSHPEKWELTVAPEENLAGHFLAQVKGKYIVWPEKIDARIVNPKNVDILFNNLPRDGLLLLDRVHGVAGFISVVGHVNRSGTNLLIANTPYDGRPQFPDMSHVYDPIQGYPQVVVHTLGPERFEAPPRENGVVWSEAVGLVAPIFHYLGFQLSALGGDPSRLSLAVEVPDLSFSV